MATIAITQGTACKFFPDGANSISGEMTSDVNIDVDLIDANTKDNPTFKEYIPGRAGATVAVSGKIDTGDTGFGVLIAKILSPASASIEWKTFNGTKQFSGSGFFSNVSLGADDVNPMTFSSNFTFDGTITYEAA